MGGSLRWAQVGHFAPRELKERYARAVHNVALRSLHEVFDADRRGLIRTISLEVGTNTTDRVTGKDIYVPLVSVGAERATFVEFDLAAVVPTAAQPPARSRLEGPVRLVPADTSGIRRG